MSADLHPAPSDKYAADHREVQNREQMWTGNELTSYWKRAVETLATELQIEPIDAHFLLQESSWEVTKGMAWEMWLP